MISGLSIIFDHNTQDLHTKERRITRLPAAVLLFVCSVVVEGLRKAQLRREKSTVAPGYLNDLPALWFRII